MVNRPKKKSKPKIDTRFSRKWHASPLKNSFMAFSMLGILISVYYIYPLSQNFGLAFLLVFLAMFIASLISMTKAPVVEKVK